MNQKDKPQTHPKILQSTGVLLTNLGTPAEATPKAIRCFLAEFLSDPRIVDIPRPLWQLILRGVILPFRPRKIVDQYQAIWQKNGSPLLLHSIEQAKCLQEHLTLTSHHPVHVELAMRYGDPSIVNALTRLCAKKVKRLIVLPLYPQYSATTVASTFDAVARVIKSWRYMPSLQLISGYADHPGYIAALIASIREYWQENGKGKMLVFSYHGLPKNSLDKGDPYYCFCQKTTRLVAEGLKLSEAHYRIAFQSRFGRAEWLQPYASDVLNDLAQARINEVDIICPGFAVDCLETLYEISEQYAKAFVEAGGKNLRLIPALNARPVHIEFLAQLLQEHGVD